MSVNDKIHSLVSKVSSTLETGIQRIVEHEVKASVRSALSDQKKMKGGGGKGSTSKPVLSKRGKKSYQSDSDASTD